MTSAETSSVKTKFFLPMWKGSLLLFGLLIAVVLAYFFWQMRQLQQTFLDHARATSKMLAGVIERNARSALLSQNAIEEILQTFLNNTARFVAYLNTIEAFTQQELTEFALENGLAGIRIIQDGLAYTEGPKGWLQNIDPGHWPPGVLQHLSSEHLYLLVRTSPTPGGYVVLGITAEHIEKLHEQISLHHLLKALSGVAEIQYVYLEPSKSPVLDKRSFLKHISGKLVAETRLPFGEKVLVTGMETRHFLNRNKQLWNEFIFFSSVIGGLGIFFSWLLHRFQTAHFKQIQKIERELARQREDAALGRAAAAISHEIRNPLNAISMGLQRLQMEADDLSDEYQNLIKNMRQALHRTNQIVGNIRQYAKPLSPQKSPVRAEQVIRHILALYAPKAQNQNIKINLNFQICCPINADSQMIEQTIENLVKNSIEAQPDGGFLSISISQKNSFARLVFENQGFDLSNNKAEQILAPYFTTKTQGTGLGLAIVQRIVQAHDGQLLINVPKENRLKITMLWPLCMEEKP